MNEPHWDDYSNMIGHINECEARIEVLEKALREIVELAPACIYPDRTYRSRRVEPEDRTNEQEH